MSEYTVEFDGKEYKFLSWNDAEAFIQQMQISPDRCEYFV